MEDHTVRNGTFYNEMHFFFTAYKNKYILSSSV